MSTQYQLVDWEDLGFNLPQSLPYPSTTTITEAVSNIRSASTFVTADRSRGVGISIGIPRPHEPDETVCRITGDQSRSRLTTGWMSEIAVFEINQARRLKQRMPSGGLKVLQGPASAAV
jgi:hypothetical protein